MYRNRMTRGRAFDAAGAGGAGLAFLESQLELIDTNLVEPLQGYTYERDLVVDTGGGYTDYISAWAADYRSSGGNEFGLQGNQNSDMPEIQADVQKGTWVAWNWAASMFISAIDLKKLENSKSHGQAPPFSLQELLDKSCRTVWNKALDKVSYLGWNGQPGLVNANASVPAVSLPVGAGGQTTWTSKTPVEILADINYLIITAIENSGYSLSEGMPDSMLVPFEQYTRLTQPMTLAGSQSVKTYLEENCFAAHNGVKFKIFPLPDPWISGQGTGLTDRSVVYKNDKRSVYIKIPQPIFKVMTVPTEKRGGGYTTIYGGCIGQVMWLRPTTAVYGDGI